MRGIGWVILDWKQNILKTKYERITIIPMTNQINNQSYRCVFGFLIYFVYIFYPIQLKELAKLNLTRPKSIFDFLLWIMLTIT